MSAESDAVDVAVGALQSAIGGDRAATQAELDQAAAALMEAEAASGVEETRLRDLLIVHGIDPATGGPIVVPPPPPPPPPPPVAGLGDPVLTGPGQVTVGWHDMVPDWFGRNGVDTTGFGPWDTTEADPPGIPAEWLVANAATFTALVEGDVYSFTAWSAGVRYDTLPFRVDPYTPPAPAGDVPVRLVDIAGTGGTF